MLKKISNISGIELLEKKDQQTILGGNKGKSCSAKYSECIQKADNNMVGGMNDCVMNTNACLADVATDYGNAMQKCTADYNKCLIAQ